MFLVGGVDRAQDVEIDSVLAQIAPALHHLVEGALLAAVDADRRRGVRAGRRRSGRRGNCVP